MEEVTNTIWAYGTFWALIPPIVAIGLALITKEVYSSLFVGIVVGAVFLCQGSVPIFLDAIFKNGLIAKVSDPYNVGILLFLVMLGAMVALMNKAGGSAAFGNWAKTHIKSKIGAQIATVLFGILIFIDDYFNCLTVGSVMRPITDRFKVSHERLAYLIDSTAAPICIIAPISSWAAAVSGFVEGEDGLALFIQAIPFNFYALLTILSLFLVVAWNVNFGPMKKYESLTEYVDEKLDAMNLSECKGKVIDLVLPIISLIIFCVIGMIYTGGFFASGDANKNFVDAFAASDASVGLAIGSVAAFIFTVCFYLSRRVLKFAKCMGCLSDGFKAMVGAILILCLAWTLKGTTDALGAKEFVAGLVNGGASSFMNFMPAIIFVIGAFLAFATGTSWGTFGILIPIVVAAFGGVDNSLMIISISACMAGAVCGDHSSPISDTTIMASAGAECHHVNHVNTQLPYVLLVAAVSFISYLVAGFTRSAIISLFVGAILVVASLFFLKKKSKA
ncbi:MAG: Na+/H+ antiporter NhaC family protein [Hallerella porci]|uniref:Transporter (NhaC family) n=1 Tax=Hallerella porci TaxID=1945871 RepID=A0ABX5LL53_9BACT|nr:MULTISPECIES: Na+/H+ antiporter NhaC family protein [Hallerella]MCI5601217.1 Na+/H+ antiporter NhaC family protein [Hallerella sp.]MDY3922654.1 Na+/H+ antiporter NhaC family protein [Hallerella porci]PWL01985.1 transporter (NhaC family) [Hallerella porci]